MTVLSLDPGKTIGRALWTNDGRLLFNDQCSLDELLDYFANTRSIDTLVVESWMLLRRMTEQMGSRMEASQVIGAAKLYARIREVDYVEQSPSILPVAHLHTGIAKPRGHLPNPVSAYLHGYYYFVVKGVLQPHAVALD